VTPGGIVLDSIVIVEEVTVQASPALAYGNGIYLVCWTDNRLEFPDVYCSRILPDGTVLDMGGFPVHADSAYQTAANVCCDDTNFLVVWSSFRGSEFSLQGARISPSGEVIDSTPLLIAQGSVSKFAPGIAFDGSNYLVEWDDSRLHPPEYDQWAARITLQGAMLDSNGIAVDTSLGNQYNNSISFLDHLYLSCWTDFGTGEGDVYGRRLTTAGDWIDTVAITICNATGHQETPCVFQDTEKFLVAWRDSRSGVMNADLYAAFIDSGAAGVQEVTEERRRQHLSLSVNPNPFIGNVHISLGVDRGVKGGGCVELGIYDVLGREVQDFTLPTAYSLLPTVISWDGCDIQGEAVPPGIYFFVLTDSTGSVTEKVLKIR
jgi:hypothetical protein